MSNLPPPPTYNQSQTPSSNPQFTYSSNFQTNFNSDFGKPAAPPSGSYPVQPQPVPGSYPVQPQPVPGSYPVQPQPVPGSYPVGPQATGTYVNPVIVTSQLPQNGNTVVVSRLPGQQDPNVRRKRCITSIVVTVFLLIVVVVINVAVRL